MSKKINKSQESDEEINLDADSDIDSDIESETNISNIETQISTKSIFAIYCEYLQKSKLLLRPEYQRKLCWSLQKMNDFIDTILKGWVIPNYVIYILSKKEIKENNHRYECIDGQHRLTTLKYYIENKELGDKKYIYWVKNKERVFYNMDEKILNSLSTKKIKCRNLTEDEKDKFDNFQMSFHMIKSSNGLKIGTKCDIFNRLQNGEKVSTYDKLKNLHQNEITNCIRSQGLCDLMFDLKFITKMKEHKVTQVNRIKKPDNFYIFFLIRTFFIIDKKSLDNNYLDVNIHRGLLANDGKGEPKYQLQNDIDELLPKVNEIINFIATTEHIVNLILPEIAYIFICIYVNYGLEQLTKVIKWLNNPINSKQFIKLNDIKSYKSTNDKVVSSKTMIEWYQTIVKLIINKNNKTDTKTSVNNNSEINEE